MITQRINRVIAAFLLMSITGMTACITLEDWMKTVVPRPSGKKVVVMLVDVSYSTKTLWKLYLENFYKAVDELGPGDSLVVSIINHDPLGTAERMTYRFEECDSFSTNPLLCKKKLVAQKEQAKKDGSEFFDHVTPSTESRIFDSTLIAAKIFSAHPPDTSRSLVLMSDMIENGDAFNFERSAPLSDAQVKKVIARLKGEKRLPNLQGVKVSVVAPMPAEGNRSSRRYLGLQRFWKEFFSSSGADLGERYGPTFDGIQ